MKSKHSHLQVYDKGILRIHPQICLDAADDHIDFRHFPSIRIRFLPEDEDIIIASAVRFDEFHGLHKHFPPGSTARISTGHVIDTMKRLQGL